MDSKLCSTGEGGTDGKDLYVYVHVCGAPPMIVGAWLMAVMLWQLHEYYYYYCYYSWVLYYIFPFPV